MKLIGPPLVVQENCGVVTLVVPDGPPVIVTAGGTVSMLNDRVADGPVLPTAVARTENA